MLDGIEEKAVQLLEDIQEILGEQSPVYVHAYDLYVDIFEYRRAEENKEGEQDGL